MSGLHTEATDGDIHTPFRWIWADATERGAETDINSNDVNKVGYQVEGNGIWILEDLTPTWTQIGGSEITVEFTVNAQVSTTIGVDVQVNKNGTAVTERYVLPMWLSDSLPPDMSATPPTNIDSGNGLLLHEFITDLYFLFQTDATGAATVNVIDSGTPTFYLNVLMPDGTIESSGAITFT